MGFLIGFCIVMAFGAFFYQRILAVFLSFVTIFSIVIVVREGTNGFNRYGVIFIIWAVVFLVGTYLIHCGQLRINGGLYFDNAHARKIGWIQLLIGAGICGADLLVLIVDELLRRGIISL